MDMNPGALDTTSSALPQALAPGSAPGAATAAIPGWQRWPGLAMLLTFVLLGFVLFPPVRDNPKLVWTFTGLAGALFAWELILWAVGRSRGQAFAIQFFPVRSHWVQACVQFGIMLYWGWFWPNVYPELPLILSQLIFVYVLEALLTWSRGRTWRLGFGPMPIVVSTNLLLWFKHDYYIYQYLMLATGTVAKQFITWNRDGKQTHIFNPSAFGQFLFALVLIGTGTTEDYTWGKEIARFFDVPHMLIVIFLGGLVVQYLFHVTLMTVAATVTLVLFSIVYTKITGVYFFVNINIAAPIFLGLHLLVTDPATSPRTSLGRIIFGVLYGLGYAILFRVLDIYGVPLFWDKLLPVPILNLCVPMIDRAMRSGFIGSINRTWETALPPKRLNLLHMTCWAAFFITLEVTGFVEGPHPGNSIPFWKKAFVEGKPHAGHSLVIAAGSQAEDGNFGAAYNELGLICMDGKIVKENHGSAAKYFAKACELNDENGCVNVAIQFLFLRERRSDEDVGRALELLEKDCLAGGNSRSCYLAGFAYENGRGRPADRRRAIELYENAGIGDLYAVKGLARLGLSGNDPPFDVRPLIQPLVRAAEGGDAECLWYLAYMYREGIGLRQSDEKARGLLQKACELGSRQACDALALPALPPYSNPLMIVPGWSTAFPLE